MTSTIMSDTAVALARQEEHLVFKSVLAMEESRSSDDTSTSALGFPDRE